MSTSTGSEGSPLAKPVELKPHVILQPPLSRCGQGPALVLIRPSRYSDCQNQNASLDPEPLQKWTEESFAVAQITFDASARSDPATIRDMLQVAKDELTALPDCIGKDQYGLISELFHETLITRIYF